MSQFPFEVTPSVDSQRWGNASSYIDLCCEAYASRKHIDNPISSAQVLSRLLSETSGPQLIKANDNSSLFCMLLAQDTFVDYKQSIHVASGKTILSSSASAYTTFYESGAYHDNPVQIFLLERDEVLSRLELLSSKNTASIEKGEELEQSVPVISTYSWSNNIQHLVIESLTQLILFDEFMAHSRGNQINTFTYLYPLPDNDFALQIGTILFGESRIAQKSKIYSRTYRNSIFLIPQQVNFRPLLSSSRHAISIIKQRIESWAIENLLNSDEHVAQGPSHAKAALVCRKGSPLSSTTRCIKNLEQITPILFSNNIDVIHPEDLAIEQRICQLSKYSTIIIEDGASFMNILFTEATHIVVFAHPLFNHNRMFFSDFVSACYSTKKQPDLRWVDSILNFEISEKQLWGRDDRFNVGYTVKIDTLQDLISQLPV